MPADQGPERFSIRIAIQPDDIDQLGHVNNVVYLRWVQDAAVAHWRATASAADQEALAWVVTRHEIDYTRPATEGDEIIATTWVGTASRLAFDRHTELHRARDGKLLAQARTVWCPIDRATGKPTKVSSAVRATFSVPLPVDGAAPP
ncbi:MAG: acyl-CoA thioesterase [Gemmatimonadota bacterium]|nr:acyl-CoA thioesterase [Gemmatimonadota bacterium]MDH5196551.1 acyl-CoA thioesterase [Gemmatimonadota bacterium]